MRSRPHIPWFKQTLPPRTTMRMNDVRREMLPFQLRFAWLTLRQRTPRVPSISPTCPPVETSKATEILFVDISILPRTSCSTYDFFYHQLPSIPPVFSPFPLSQRHSQSLGTLRRSCVRLADLGDDWILRCLCGTPDMVSSVP